MYVLQMDVSSGNRAASTCGNRVNGCQIAEDCSQAASQAPVAL